MEPKNLLEMLNDIEGHKCKFETHDGAYRTEVVHHVMSREIRYGNVTLSYPMVVYFDQAETDFMHLGSLKAIDLIE